MPRTTVTLSPPNNTAKICISYAEVLLAINSALTNAKALCNATVDRNFPTPFVAVLAFSSIILAMFEPKICYTSNVSYSVYSYTISNFLASKFGHLPCKDSISKNAAVRISGYTLTAPKNCTKGTAA